MSGFFSERENSSQRISKQTTTSQADSRLCFSEEAAASVTNVSLPHTSIQGKRMNPFERNPSSSSLSAPAAGDPFKATKMVGPFLLQLT